MKLMRMLGTSLALAGLGLGVASTALAQVPAKKPNILFIVSDDTGYGDLGPTAAARGAACRRRASTRWRPMG
jgi:hypothetical protein